MRGMNKMVSMILKKNSRYNRILEELSNAENALKNKYGIDNFDQFMDDFNHQHMNHTRFLMKCAYSAGMSCSKGKRNKE